MGSQIWQECFDVRYLDASCSDQCQTVCLCVFSVSVSVHTLHRCLSVITSSLPFYLLSIRILTLPPLDTRGQCNRSVYTCRLHQYWTSKFCKVWTSYLCPNMYFVESLCHNFLYTHIVGAVIIMISWDSLQDLARMITHNCYITAINFVGLTLFFNYGWSFFNVGGAYKSPPGQFKLSPSLLVENSALLAELV